MADTKIVNRIAVDSIGKEYIVKENRRKAIKKWIKSVSDAVEEFKAFSAKDWEDIENKPFIYVKSLNILMGDPRRMAFHHDKILNSLAGIKTKLPDAKMWTGLFKRGDNPIVNEEDKINNKGTFYKYLWYVEGGLYYKCNCTGTYSKHCYSFSPSSDTLCLPVADCPDELLKFFISNELVFKSMKTESKTIFRKLSELYNKKYLEFEQNGVMFSDNFINDVVDKKLDSLELISVDESGSVAESEPIELSDEYLKERYLECDKHRAGLAAYDSKRLEDINLGHWDLWQSDDVKGKLVSIKNRLVGRNPAADIRDDGVVGIDFGTKSTVVVYQNGSVRIKPMRIGDGDYNKAIRKESYENPTVMEFINFENFLNAYNGNDKGRPETKYNDLMISHAAQSDFSSNTNTGDDYYAFFSDLKQWANDKNRQVIIKDKEKHVRVMPAYMELKSDDMDPIEIYAYNIGLFINNMYNGIYLNYIMSFPTTYELRVREKLLNSFTAGIKRSLPQVILDDEEIMNRFRVVQGASEPAAYAVCALSEKGFGENDEAVYYGIFDFGGGTTDFDFGVWKPADKKLARRYDYVINHFGDGGDSFLGGENLLEMLAFKVFYDNRGDMLEKNISFYKPIEADSFPGCERLLMNSQEAKLNTRMLMEKLRAFWEKGEKIPNPIKLNLYKNDGGTANTVELNIKTEELENYLKYRIKQGIVNFFEAMLLAFNKDNAADMKEIVIFLAGNSSRSRYVRALFDSQSEYYAEKMIEKLGIKEVEASGFFSIYAPLGFEDSDDCEIAEAVGESIDNYDRNDESLPYEFEKPNAKTGVAFGLLMSMPGSRVKVESEKSVGEEIKFRYYVGYNYRNKFIAVIDRDVEYRKWIEFIDASEPDFELYYTSLPEAATGEMLISGASKKLCRVLETHDDAMVYIRITAPSTIEYVAALPSKIEKGEYLADPVTLVLGKE